MPVVGVKINSQQLTHTLTHSPPVNTTLYTVLLYLSGDSVPDTVFIKLIPVPLSVKLLLSVAPGLSAMLFLVARWEQVGVSELGGGAATPSYCTKLLQDQETYNVES